jgi:hypothetical protein
MAIHWGVSAAEILRITKETTVSSLMKDSQARLAELKGAVVIFTCGVPLGTVGATNLIFRGRVGEPWP